MKDLTQEEKVKLFKEKHYSFKPPPVCTARWTKADWMKWIDYAGKWDVKKEDSE